jgi:hypothetical protein
MHPNDDFPSTPELDYEGFRAALREDWHLLDMPAARRMSALPEVDVRQLDFRFWRRRGRLPTRGPGAPCPASLGLGTSAATIGG